MAWIDYKKYSHYPQLEQLFQTGLLDYANLRDKDIKQMSDNILKAYSHIPWPDKVDWHIHPLIKGKQINKIYADYWPQTVNYAQNIPGLISLNVNFVDGHSIIPDHRDDMLMLTEVEEWRKELGYITVIGIEMPGKNINEVGFHVNHVKKFIGTGDIVTFDGSSVHGGWNNTDKRRVTFYISINKGNYAII